MHVQHESMRVREQRHRRIEDAEKRRQYRIAHGLEEPEEKGQVAVDDQSPVAAAAAAGVVAGDGTALEQGQGSAEFVDWEGKKKPVKKWLGIW